MTATKRYVDQMVADDSTHTHAGGGAHPDLATHNTLGLATQAELDAHTHTGTYATAGHNHDASYAAEGHTHAGGSGPSTLKKTADQIINGTAFQNVTDLTFAVSANTDYAFSFYIVFRSAATTTGFRFGVNGPAGGVVDYVLRYQTVANSAAAGVATYLDQHNVAYDSMTVTTATITAGVDLYAKIEGRIRVGGTAGTFAVRAASELANNDLVIQKGSWGIYF